MKAEGPELDALVAEKVLRLTLPERPLCPDCGTKMDVQEYQHKPPGWWCLECHMPMDPWPAFSTDMTAAWKVVEALREAGRITCSSGFALGFMAPMMDGAPPEYGSWLCRIGRVQRSAATAPLAICLAALALMESDGERAT